MTTLQPTGSRILVQIAKPTEKIVGGVILPESSRQDESTRGTIVAVGPKVTDVKAGDTILLLTFNGTEVKVDEKDYVLTDETAILAVIG